MRSLLKITDRFLFAALALLLWLNLYLGFDRAAPFTFDIALQIVAAYALCALLYEEGTIKDLAGKVRKNLFPVAFLGFIAVSLFWSEAPRVIETQAFLILWFLGLYFGTRLSYFTLMRVLDGTLALGVILLLVLASPAVAGGLPAVSTGDPNLLMGILAVPAGIVFLLFAVSQAAPWLRGLNGVLGLIAFFMIFQTDSLTLILTCAAIFSAIAMYYIWFRWGAGRPGWLAPGKRTSLLVYSSITVVVIAVAFLLTQTTFGGRTPLWAALWPYLVDRPMGYGYHAFWAGHGPEVARLIKSRSVPENALNAFIDLFLGAGIGGLVLLIAALVVGLKRAWLFLSNQKKLFYIGPFAFLVMILIIDLGYSLISGAHNFYTFLLAIALTIVTPVTGESQQEI